MFVIVQSLENLGSEDEDQTLEQRIGLTMKHAGIWVHGGRLPRRWTQMTGKRAVLMPCSWRIISHSASKVTVWMRLWATMQAAASAPKIFSGALVSL